MTAYAYGGNSSPELGWGVVEKWQVNNEILWQGVVLLRIAYNVPSEDVTTQGEEVEWQTQQASATIMREQQGKKLWLLRSAMLETEDAAAAFVRTVLNVPDVPEG